MLVFVFSLSYVCRFCYDSFKDKDVDYDNFKSYMLTQALALPFDQIPILAILWLHRKNFLIVKKEDRRNSSLSEGFGG